MLPVAALVEQFKASANYSFVRYFDIIFIRHSLDRLPLSERLQLIPRILKGIGTDGGKHLDSLFNIFLRLLHDLRLPPRGSEDDTKLRSQLGLDDPQDAEYVAQWLGKLFLVVRDNQEQSLRRGLKEDEYKFLMLPNAKGIWKDETKDTRNATDADRKALSLTETCKKAAKFLESAAFTDGERFVPALYASAHPNEAVSSLGNDMLKRTTLTTDDPNVLKELFAAYAISGYVTRTRILRLLSTSRTAATYAEDIYAVFRISFGEFPGFPKWAPKRLSDAPGADDYAEPDRIEQLEPASPEAMEIDSPYQDTKSTPLPVAENLKGLLQFLNWVATVGLGTDDLANLSAFVTWALAKFKTQYLDFMKHSVGDIELGNQIYETIGILVKAHPRPYRRVYHLLQWLLASLWITKDGGDSVIYLNAAVSAITSVFRPEDDEQLTNDLVEAMLEYMVPSGFVNGTSPRHAAAKIANDCIPFSNITARWIDILASTGTLDERTDVVDEGRRGLDPWTYRRDLAGPRTLPDWRAMALAYFQGSKANFYRDGPDALSKVTDRPAVDFVTYPGNTDVRLDAKWAKALSAAIGYCQKVLYLTALPDFPVKPGWEGQLKVLVASDQGTRDTIRRYLADTGHGEALLQLLAASVGGMQLLDDNVQVAESSARSFVEIASLAPMSVVGRLAGGATVIRPLLRSSRGELQLLGAKAFGIVGAHPGINPTEAGIVKEFNQVIRSALGSDDGLILGAAHLLSRQIYYGTISRSEVEVEVLRGIRTIKDTPPSSMDFVTEAFIQLWTAGIPAFGQPADSTDRTAFIKKEFIDPLSEQAKKGKEIAIRALGRLAIAAGTSETSGTAILDLILSKLYELHEVKQAEVHLAVGEAIAAAVACWDSEAVKLILDIQSETTAYRIPKRSDKLIEVLDKLLTDSKNTKPSLVKSSGMVLFCIIQYCSHLEEVQNRLRDCHVAFMRLLTARDDLVQETASRALALIYEKGDPSLRDQLVRDFVTFFTGSGQQLKDDEEPESSGTAVSSSSAGKSSISYKDIVRLANEAGDQKLVYKFMALANSAINWSSESAFGRFGLRDILSNPEVGVDEKLYPILFRSRFDPSPTTQKSMRAIWNAMVKDTTSVLETHYDTIMSSLLKSMLGREWRIRQASCAAVKDLIDGRPFKKYQPYYKDMLAAALKLLDDMKESVRQTALTFFSYLTHALLRQLEENGSTASTTAMMDEVLPFLLSDRGIDSSVSDVKNSAAITIQEIAKRGGKALKPYIVMMVPVLLGLLSTYEPEVITYAYQQVGQDTREELDKRRAAAVYQGPVFESITNCLRHADKKIIGDLAPALEETMRAAVGMPTKIGSSAVIVHLAERHKEDFEPFCGRFLQLMEKYVLDRNDTVSKNYAKAAACIIRIAPSEDQVRFVEHVINLWFDSEDETRRRKVVDVVLGIRHFAPDHFDALEPLLLPFVFLGMNEYTDEYVHKQSEQLWAAVGGSPHKVARYIPEIVALVGRSLSVGNWAVKHAGALTSGKVVVSLVEGRIANANNLREVWLVLEKSLALKTFAHKEELLEALGSFATTLSALTPAIGDSQIAKDLKKIAMREAKRNNETYRPHAFKSLQIVASALKVDMLDEISDIVGPSIVEFQEEELNDTGLRLQTVTAAIEAIAKGYYEANMRQDPFSELSRVIWALEKHALPKAKPSPVTLTEAPLLGQDRFQGIRANHWYPLAESTLKAAHTLKQTMPSKRPSGSEPSQRLAVIRWFLSTLDLDKTQSGTEAQRQARVDAVLAALELWKTVVVDMEDKAEDEAFTGAVSPLVEQALAEERAPWGGQKWRACLHLLRLTT